MSVHYQKLPSIGNNASDVKFKKKQSKQRKEGPKENRDNKGNGRK